MIAITEQQAEKIIDRYINGATWDELATEYKAAKNTFQGRLRKFGYNLRAIRRRRLANQPIQMTQEKADFECSLLSAIEESDDTIENVIKKFGVSRSYFYDIKSRWIPSRTSERNKKIFQAYKEGMTEEDIGSQYNLDPDYVWRIVNAQRFQLNGSTLDEQ